MASLLQLFGIAAGGSFALSRYAPEYSLGLVVSTILLFVFLVGLNVIWTGSVYPRYFSPLRDLPMAPGLQFPLGHTRQIMKESSGVPHREWMNKTKNDGLIRYVNWGRERVFVTKPHAIKELLATKSYEFVKPAQFRRGFGKILGLGILFAEGDEHKIQRKNLIPAFAFRHVKDLYPIFWDKAGDLVEALSEASAVAEKSQTVEESKDGKKHAPGAIDISGWISRSTLDIIGVSGLDRDFGALRDPDNELSRQYGNVLNPSGMRRYIAILGLLLPAWFVERLPFKDNQNISHAADYVKGVCRDMVVKKRQAIAEKKTTRPDIISIALASGHFSDEELVNQMMTFLIAGHETTASAMAWVVYTICKYPDIQKKLRDAVRAKIPSLRSEITTADIDECHYLNAFCREVLRLWPPVSMTLRVASKDSSLNGHFIPKNTLVIVPPMAVNVSKEMWGPDANEFKPERWLDADGRANNSGGAESAYSFLTFLHGPRACIGQKFAEAEFACLVAALAGSFEVRFEENSVLAEGFPEIKGGITSRPKAGVWVHLKEIGGW